MNSKRLYYLLIGLIILMSIGLFAGAYGTNKLLTSQAAKLTSLKAKSGALTQEQSTLKKAKADVEKYAALDAITKAVVPQDKDQAEAVREIVNIAAQNNVRLAAINFPASNLGTTGTGAAITTAPASAAASAAANKSSSLSQLQPVKNIAGVYSLPITVVGDPNKPVAYDKFIAFLSALERNRRTAQVSSIIIQPSASNRNLLIFTLNLNEYIKP